MKKRHFAIGKTVAFILFSVYTATLFFAWGWVLIQSLKNSDVYLNDKLSFPHPPTFLNYKEALLNFQTEDGVGMFEMIFNSIWYSFGSLFIQMASAVVAAYTIAKFKFPGRNFLYMLALFSMMIPIVGSMPSAYRIYDMLGILNTPKIVIKNLNAFGWNFVVIYGFFKSVSWNYAESAYIDGAGHFTVFFKIMLPQVLTPVFALCIMSFISLWNDYMTPLIYFPDFPTLVTGLYLYEDQMGRQLNYPTLFAGVIICILPVLVIFVLFQEKLLEVNIGGGLKG